MSEQIVIRKLQKISTENAAKLVGGEPLFLGERQVGTVLKKLGVAYMRLTDMAAIEKIVREGSLFVAFQPNNAPKTEDEAAKKAARQLIIEKLKHKLPPTAVKYEVVYDPSQITEEQVKELVRAKATLAMGGKVEDTAVLERLKHSELDVVFTIGDAKSETKDEAAPTRMEDIPMGEIVNNIKRKEAEGGKQ